MRSTLASHGGALPELTARMPDKPVEPKSIYCISHLAWEPTLFQRPQQLMQRFAARGYRVNYVGCVGVKRKRQLPESGTTAGVTWYHSNYAAQASALAAMRQKFASFEVRQHIPGRQPIVWMYHPSLLPLVSELPRALLVYDVMDCFDAFEKGSAQASTDERVLLERADVLFTGGITLQENIEQKLTGIQRAGAAPASFPSGVEFDHFAKAAADELPIPDELSKLPKPIFGYFGAVDERIDYGLLGQLEASGGSIVLIGPEITPAPELLPANVHLLGGRPYSELPGYLRGFDVCLLPFKTSVLVEHISPTKTPEYLAGGKPVVSTLIPDVAASYGDVVSVANTADEFVRLCREAYVSPPNRGRLQEAARRARSWEQIAEVMDALLQQRLG